MSPLLINVRIALTVMLISLSNLTGAMQIELDEKNEECAGTKGTLSAQYHITELDDQDNEHCFKSTGSDNLPNDIKKDLLKHSQSQTPEKERSLIRAPPKTK